MNKYNKHYLKRDPSSQRVMVVEGKPVLGEVAKKDCPLEDWHVKALNKSWEKTGIYYVEMEVKKEVVKATKSEARLKLESEAEELGINYRDNIGDEKLQEKINQKLSE